MNRNTRYWLCQFIGWGAWILFNLIIIVRISQQNYLSPEAKRNLLFYTLFVNFLCYLISTHLLRYFLKKIKWINFNSTKVFLMFIVSVFITAMLTFYTTEFLSNLPKTSLLQYVINEEKEKAITMEKDMQLYNTDYYLYEKDKKLDSSKYSSFLKIKKATSWYRDKNNQWKYEEPKGKNLGNIFTDFILIALWLLIYMAWHYVDKNRNDQLDKLRLEAVVKSLELKTIKSHINPHFIFNALNSIRALVDENPIRARTAITELSNILRSSLQAEKLETVPLEQELEIVQDYLALEHMRFEERLQIQMNINTDTLKQPIPPMMLQNLVENAIKHGISKQMMGGVIAIKSFIENGNHILIVENTGNLQAATTTTASGFGIKSTQDRLNLLYQSKAHFEITELQENIVQCKITMPKIESL